jgi:hypothetical protein
MAEITIKAAVTPTFSIAPPDVVEVTGPEVVVTSAGDVVGPSSSTDDAVVLFDGVTGKLLKELPGFQTLTPTGTTQAIDLSAGRQWVIDLGSATGDVTLTLNNPLDGAVYTIKVIQGATDRNLVWPAAVLWPAGTAPTITSGDDVIDTVQLVYDGTYYLSVFSQAYA